MNISSQKAFVSGWKYSRYVYYHRSFIFYLRKMYLNNFSNNNIILTICQTIRRDIVEYILVLRLVEIVGRLFMPELRDGILEHHLIEKVLLKMFGFARICVGIITRVAQESVLLLRYTRDSKNTSSSAPLYDYAVPRILALFWLAFRQNKII